ncbi:nitroreductase/quinone reductase family protein [Dactylosporangium sp. NPDC005555]|uniref:nitroreductase/quinone reductase family protein n=1 Tax=Dactylosporangium sp. NPDC005555 TaxID=3154889 RepID=UPI0033B24325
MFGSLLKRLGHRPWFAAAARRIVGLDRWLQRRSKGRIVPINAAGVTTLLLTTTGRKSGQPRSQPLLFVRDGEDFIVIGSNWGQAHHPAWTANLLADPRCTITWKQRDVRATGALVRDEERARLLELLTASWPAYATYQERAAGREIRIFRLSEI